MNGREKSERSVVPRKRSNKVARAAAEAVEGRDRGKGNVGQQNAQRTQSRASASHALDRVRQAARRDRKARFTALMHHLTIERLREAFAALAKQAAPGVDGVTWQQYREELEANLRDLHGRLHRGAYRAKPSRRAYIPKADGRLRPLGVAALEDKVVQRALAEVLNAIYEEDFLGFSYGFRPRRSQHDALDALAYGIHRRAVNWVLDADIRGFFDAIDHGWLMRFVEHRIGDRRVLRLIQKWLRAGVIAEGEKVVTEEGTPQGATISPLLANLYLHYVFDLWSHQWRRRRACGEVIVVRYADDFIVGFQHREDAERYLAELRRRLQGFGLELHPDKTRLIEFGRYAAKRRARRGQGRPETFDFLGFTHICGRSMDGEHFVLVRRTIRQRMLVKLREVKAQLESRRHAPLDEQGQWLGRVVRGYFEYYAVPTNSRALCAFRQEATKRWRQALRRRGNRRGTQWRHVRKLVAKWLPPARIQHPWPDARFDVKTRAKSRVR
jgi:RNA-directed DNA polymerase